MSGAAVANVPRRGRDERKQPLVSPPPADNVEAELLHTFTKVYKFDTMLLLVRLAVLTAVTLTVPIVLFPVSPPRRATLAFPLRELRVTQLVIFGIY